MEKQIIKTISPYEELDNYAKDNKTDPDLLDFKIINYETTIRNGKNTKTFSPQELEAFNDDEVFNGEYEITQTYEISIIKKTNPLMEFKIGTNKNLTRVVAHFEITNFDISHGISNIYENIVDLIYKRFIKQGLLIGIRQFNFQQQILKALKSFENKQISEAKILLAKGIDPIDSVNSQVKYYYKDKKTDNDEIKKLDYSQRGFIESVSKDELLIEFIKPIIGKNGRNLKGEVLPAINMILDNEPDFRVSEHIKEVDEGSSLKYYANINGYISYSAKDKLYDIKDSVSVKSVDFKTTGSIDAGINKDITLNIEEDDKLKDAIGANLTIEVSTLNVKGNVAQNTTIRAKEVNIGGQTHSKSKIYADHINISVHKGYCEGDFVVIDKLEGGVVVGKNVQVKQALGGRISATKVKIDTLTTNTKIESGELVVIKECLGENNKLSISVSKSPLIAESLEKILKGLQDCDKVIQTLPKSIESKKFVIESNKDSVAQIKERIREMKQTSTLPPSSFIRKIKDYQKTINEYNEMSTILKDAIEKQQYLKHNLKILENKIYDAKVVNLGKWSNLNEIKFKLLHPETELIYSTKANEEIYCLKLERVVVNGKETPEITKFSKSEIGDFDDIEIIESDEK